MESLQLAVMQHAQEAVMLSQRGEIGEWEGVWVLLLVSSHDPARCEVLYARNLDRNRQAMAHNQTHIFGEVQ
jgi:hypothetical protein